jgi:hypothetical protein
MVGSEKGKLKKEEVNAVGGNEPVGTKPNYASLGLSEPLAEGGAAPAAPFNAFAGNGIVGRFGPVGDKASLSLSEPTKPLNGGASAPVGAAPANVPVVQNAPSFQKDDTKKDGGFFGWLGGLIKKRPGIRSGESADEYDERMTRNKMRIATLADTIRHMYNIYYTSKGAPLQRFNSPVEGLQNGLQQRKNERARQAALEADRAYKAMDIELKQKAGERADKAAKAMDDYRKGMLGIQEGNLKLSSERLGETKRHNKAQEGLSASRLALARVKAARTAGGSGSGSSGGGGGGFSSLTNLSTPNGHMNRKKDLNAIEKKQIRDYLYKNGFITKSAAEKYEGASTVQERGAILNGWIGWVANSKGTKADKFRKALADHYGYVETKTVRSKNTPAKSNPIRWQGSGSKPKPQSKPTNKGRGTDWSQYVK